MIVLNYGNVRIATNFTKSRFFTLLPMISFLSPVRGSIGGGTLLKITGSGYLDSSLDIFVLIDGFLCDIVSSSFTEIMCSTPVLPAGEKNVTVILLRNGIENRVPCGSCFFTYDTALTTTFGTITPQTISKSPQIISITGTKFGMEADDISVTIAGQICHIQSSPTDSSFQCEVSNVPAGTHDVYIHVGRKGNAIGNGQIIASSIIDGITPGTVGVYGGTEITISGYGFMDEGMTVMIGGKHCTNIITTIITLTCIVPENNNGEHTVIVEAPAAIFTLSGKLTYSSTIAPSISSLSSTIGNPGDTLVISGVKFAVSNSVSIGGVDCPVTLESAVSISCTIPWGVAGGSHPVVVKSHGIGNSNNAHTISFELQITSVMPNSGKLIL